MNREILFRGKRLDNGALVYGSFIPDLLEIYQKGPDGNWLGDWGFIKPFGKTKEERLMVEVERATVGQYTGLTDMNGVKIFEGDILRYIDPDTQEYDIGEKFVAGWDEDEACILFECFVYGKSIGYDVFNQKQAKNLEVIGNTFDNSELLKEV